MAEKEDVTKTVEAPREHKIPMYLKNFNGEVIFELKLQEPLPFPYVFHEHRLFVASKDDANTYLERSYCVYVATQEPPKARRLSVAETH